MNEDKEMLSKLYEYHEVEARTSSRRDYNLELSHCLEMGNCTIPDSERVPSKIDSNRTTRRHNNQNGKIKCEMDILKQKQRRKS